MENEFPKQFAFLKLNVITLKERAEYFLIFAYIFCLIFFQHSEYPDVPIQVRKSGISSISPSINNKNLKDKLHLVGKTVPRFFWPEGKPMSNAFLQQCLSKAEDKLKTENNCLHYEQFGEVMKFWN